MTFLVIVVHRHHSHPLRLSSWWFTECCKFSHNKSLSFGCHSPRMVSPWGCPSDATANNGLHSSSDHSCFVNKHFFDSNMLFPWIFLRGEKAYRTKSQRLVTYWLQRQQRQMEQAQSTWWNIMTQLQNMLRYGAFKLFLDGQLRRDQLHNYLISGES